MGRVRLSSHSTKRRPSYDRNGVDRIWQNWTAFIDGIDWGDRKRWAEHNNNNILSVRLRIAWGGKGEGKGRRRGTTYGRLGTGALQDGFLSLFHHHDSLRVCLVSLVVASLSRLGISNNGQRSIIDGQW